jgi:outer membrane protein assembly factor BamB
MPRFGKYGFCTASLATDGSTLYAAGNLGVVAFDAATGARRWSVGVAGGEASQVALGRAVAYIVGDFTRVGGVARRGLAALDARTGKLMSWTVALDSVPGPQPAFVTAIAVSGGTVYVGGYFKGVGGKVQPNLAAVSAATGRAIGRAPMRRTAAPDASRGIVVSHRLLIAGHDTLVAVDTRSGKPARWPNAIRGSAYIFSVGGDTLYMGSDIRYGFERAGGRPANNLAAVRLPDGPVLPWRPILAPYTIIESLAASRGTVIVIGEFLRTIS